MLKKISILYLCLFNSLLIIGQTVGFAGSIADFSKVKVMDMEKTTDDGLVIAVDFPGHRHMGGYYGLYKYNNLGIMVWKFQFFGSQIDFLFLDCTLDESNNIYGLVYVDEYQESTIQGITVYPGLNLIKINPQGTVIWNKKIGILNEESDADRNACIIYKNGNLYVMGTYKKSLNLDNQFFFTSQEYYQCYMWMYFAGTDYFVAKYDTNGVVKNAISLGEDYPDDLISMEIDEDENIYFAGLSDNFPCVSAYYHITKLDSNLSVQWVNSLSHDTDSPCYIPMNIHNSKNGNLYVWNNANDNISNGFRVTNNKSPYLMEMDKNNGQILRSLSINTKSLETDYISVNKRYVNGFMDDFGNDLIVHTAFLDTLILGNDTIYSRERYQNLVLLRINLMDLSVSLIGKMGGESELYYWDMPGKVIVKEPNIYFTGEFGENPLEVFGVQIPNMSGNVFDTNVFLCKVDMSSYLGNSAIIDSKHVNENLIVYPNPVSNLLYIKTESEILMDVTIFTIDGKIIPSTTNAPILDVSNLSNGIYFIRIQTNHGYKSGRFMIKH